MPAVAYDFAVFGSTPFATILAGLLARQHGRRVLRVGSRASPQRLPRRLDFALPLASRPEAWDLLIRGEAEVRALLRSVGAPDSLVPANIRITADTQASAGYFGHVAHLALASGLRVSRSATSLDFRGVPLLRSERAEDKLSEWLATAGVRSIDPHEIRIELKKGSATLAAPDGEIEAAQIILADDTAILELPPDLRPTSLRVEDLTSTLVEKLRPLGAPIVLLPDRRVALFQRDDGSVLALVGGSDVIEERLGSAFAGPFPIARLATGRSHHLVSADGAAVVGAIDYPGLMVASGMGSAAVFFAPALARHFADAASEGEARWFAARDPSRQRSAVSEAIS